MWYRLPIDCDFLGGVVSGVCMSGRVCVYERCEDECKSASVWEENRCSCMNPKFSTLDPLYLIEDRTW